MPRDGVVYPSCSNIKKQEEPSERSEHGVFALDSCMCGARCVKGKEIANEARKQMEKRLETVKVEIEAELAKGHGFIQVEIKLSNPVLVSEDKERMEGVMADARRAADLEINQLRQALELEIRDAIADNAEEAEVMELIVEMEGKLAMAIMRKVREVDGLRQRLEQDHRLRMVVAIEEAQDAFRKPIDMYRDKGRKAKNL